MALTYKDQFRVVGVETSVCYIGWLGPIETEDSVLTGILRKLGAVFYGTLFLASLMDSENYRSTKFDVWGNNKQHYRVILYSALLIIDVPSIRITTSSHVAAPPVEKVRLLP